MAILHEKLGWGLVKVWWVGYPSFVDLAKIRLADGQPGSDTKSVRTGLFGILISQKTAFLLTSPRITVS